MSSTDSKRALLQGQANTKVYWGTSRAEVTEWLTTERGLSPTDAEEIVQNAFRARKASVRRRAIMYLVFSALGILLAVAFAIWSVAGALRQAWYLAVATGVPSLGFLIKSLVELARGDTDEPLE